MRKDRAPLSKTRIASASIALVCAAGLAAAPVALAGASASGDAQTGNWRWHDVTDNGVSIYDVSAYYPDFAGTGLGLFGWARDGFDELFFDPFGGDPTGEWFYLGETAQIDFDPIGAPDYGSDSIVSQGYQRVVIDLEEGATAEFDAYITLEMEGSFARWTLRIEPANGADVSNLIYDLRGELGSDFETTVVTVADNQLVSYQAPADAIDPIIGWHLEADSAAIGVHPGDPDNMGPWLGGEVVVSGVGDFVLTIGVVDYDPCSFDEALDYMVATVPDFPAVAGGSLASFYTVDCLQLPTPAPQVVGTPLDILIPLELPAEFFVWHPAWQGDDYSANFAVAFLDIPAGVSGQVVDVAGAPYLNLTGTVPAQESTIEAVLYSTFENPQQPFISTVTLPVTTAATGASPQMPWFIAGAVLLSALGIAILARRRADA